jgi:hypothetical protein
MQVKKRIAVAALGVLALGGVGAGVAFAATSPSTNITDTATPGDTTDTPGATDGDNVQEGDQTGPDTPGAAETPDTPGA